MSKTQASINATDIGMRSALAFTKMQALGNDFVFVAERDLAASASGKRILADLQNEGGRLAQQVCDRHFGIGADGLIVVRKAQRADCQIAWSYFNSDGSVSAMCGNGLRCLGLYAVENQLVGAARFNVETAVGAVPVEVVDSDSITSDLGEPILDAAKIPVQSKKTVQSAADARAYVRDEITVAGRQLQAVCVSMGNPHCVVFNSSLTDEEQRHWAPIIQQMPLFPQGVNVEFTSIVSPKRARVFVWERGCGPTLACASGAAGVLVAGVLEGVLERRATIELPGGPLDVSWSAQDNRVRITGPARVAFCGTVDLDRFTGGAR
jgi:diaminopimelate epimerase